MNQEQMNLRIPKRMMLIIGLIGLLLTALALRFSLYKFKSADYVYFFQGWYGHIHQAGFAAFKDNFSNYNLPYLYLLYLANVLHLPALLAVKLIPTIFDGVLAYSIYLTVRHFRPKSLLPFVAALGSLFLPTVFLNSSAWGQCDSIYTSFLVLTFYATLKHQTFRVWLFWSIALCFKLQAIFFLPFLAYIWLTRRQSKWWAPALVIPIFFVPFIPALVAGRSFSSILGIYKSQATSSDMLTWGAANMYQWIGGDQSHFFNKAGIFLTLGLIIGLLASAIAFVRRYSDDKTIAYLAALSLFLVPFFLPQMHDRYFYPAELFAFIIAFINPKYAFLAISAELIGFFSYAPFLFQKDPTVSLGILAVVQLANIVVLLSAVFFAQQLPSKSSQSKSR